MDVTEQHGANKIVDESKTEPGDSEFEDTASNFSLQERNGEEDGDALKLSEIIGGDDEDGNYSQDLQLEKKELKSYPEEIKEMIENADQLSKKVALNSALLEKLKTELISHKMKYAENKMILADVHYPPLIKPRLTMRAPNSKNKLKSRK